MTRDKQKKDGQKKDRPKKFDVVVLGAGIIGTSTAWHLQRRGQKTALLDRQEPGFGTSYGNAGLIERSSVIPYHFPRRLRELLRYGLNTHSAMRYDLSYLPKIMPWLYQFWRHSSPENLGLAANAMLPLIEHSISEHDGMIAAAGLQNLRRVEGWIEIFREPSAFHAAKADLVKLEPYHLTFEILDGGALAAREPALTAPLAGAIHWLDPHTITAPDALVQGYCQHFIAQGGMFLHGDANSLTRTQQDGWQLETQDGTITADNVVLALGWESAALLKKITGISVPLLVKRGYHMHYAQGKEQEIQHPLCDSEAGFVLAPMQRGLRLTTGIEFAPPTSAANEIQLRHCERIARQYCHLGERLDERVWLGHRPCLPDMRPIISEVDCPHPGLWVNFGHAHHGLTLGPASGRLLAEMMVGEQPFTKTEPFSIKRFGKRFGKRK